MNLHALDELSGGFITRKVDISLTINLLKAFNQLLELSASQHQKRVHKSVHRADHPDHKDGHQTFTEVHSIVEWRFCLFPKIPAVEQK